MEHTEFAVGQVWTRGKGDWETGRRIVEVDRRMSVILLKVEDWLGGFPKWVSAGVFQAWIEDSGATMRGEPTCTIS